MSKEPAKFQVGQQVYSGMHEKFVVITERYWDTRSWFYRFKDLPLSWNEENISEKKNGR